MMRLGVMMRAGFMKKRSGAVSIAARFAFGVGLSALASASQHSSAQAQSADLVLCDRLAADPADPDKPADVKGTRDIAPSDITTAIKFCKVAVGGIAPGALSARPRLCGQSTNAGGRRRLPQGGRQGQHDRHGRARRAARDRGGRAQGRSPGAAAVRARRRRRQPARRRQSRGPLRQAAARRRIRPRPAPCFRKPRRPIRRRRSISSE